MGKNNFKQYMFVLSTVGMLNTACQFGSDRLGMVKTPANGGLASGTTHGTSGIKETLNKQGPLMIQIYLHGMSHNPSEFNEFQQYEGEQVGNKLMRITPIWRSKKGENSDYSNDICCSMEVQVEELYKEFSEQIQEKLHKDYGWEPDQVEKEWKNIPITILGSSQGGLLAFEIHKKYKDELKIEWIRPFNISGCGIPGFDWSLEKFQSLTEQLNLSELLSKVSGQASLPKELVEFLKNLVPQAIKEGFGEVSLWQLLNSYKDDLDMHRKFQEKLGQDYEYVVDNVEKNYRGFMDIHSSVKTAQEYLRVDINNKSIKSNSNTSNTSETNNKCNPRISLGCSIVGGPTKALIISAMAMCKSGEPISTLINEQVVGGDGVFSGREQLVKRRKSFQEDKMGETIDKYGSGAVCSFSDAECQKFKYKEGVQINVFPNNTHPGLRNIINGRQSDIKSLIKDRISLFIPFLNMMPDSEVDKIVDSIVKTGLDSIPLAVFEDPKLFPELTQEMCQVLGLESTAGTKAASTTSTEKNQPSTLKDCDDLD